MNEVVKGIREYIQERRRTIDRARHEIRECAAANIEDYHFLRYEVSTFWTCDDSPIGMCLWMIEDGKGELIHAANWVCRYCGGPTERK